MSATIVHYQHDVAEKLCDKILSALRIDNPGAMTNRSKSRCSIRISPTSKVGAYIGHRVTTVHIELFVPPEEGDQEWRHLADRSGIRLVSRAPSKRWGQRTRLRAVIEEGQLDGAVALIRKSADYRASV